MNKIRNFIALALILALVEISPARAGIKFDISHTFNKGVEIVSGAAEQAQQAFEESTTIQTMIKYGKGAIEAAKWMKEQQKLVKSTISDTTGAINSVKETATSTIAEAQKEASGLTGDVIDAAGGAAGGLTSAASAAAAKTQAAQQLLALKNEKSSLESEYNTAAAARKTEFEGQIKSYEDNNATYQKMMTEDPSQKEALETKIISNNEVVRFLREQFDKREAEEKAASDKKIAEVDAKIQDLRDQAAAESAGLAKDAFGAAKSLFGNNQSAAELNKTIANNFIPAKEAITSDAIKKVMDYRNKTAAKDVLEGYATVLQIRANRDVDNSKTEETADNVTAMEGSSAALVMDAQLKVNNMKGLLQYTKLLIIEMKMRSAMDLASLKVYQLRNPDKDVTQFNLDDYKFKKPSKLNKKNIMDLAKKGTSAVSEAKSGNLTDLVH